MAFPSGTDGVLQVVRDVAVSPSHGDELVAISREAGVLGELLRLDVPGQALSVDAEVVESRPVVLGGSVRHRLRLRRVPSAMRRLSDGGADAIGSDPR